ncbi:MAG: DUF1361 domain-containing protein [Saprospiraceae bacterium]|nr:DUF1361 domain-containing protein [Saprospiraceae bacterium]
MNRNTAKWIAVGLIIFWNGLMVGYRMQVTGHRVFLFFIWNLFLAFLPFLCSQAAVFFQRQKAWWISLAMLGISVLFLPNSPYIVTDLFHLRTRAEMPLWFDTLLIYSMATSGLIFFYLALFDILKVVRHWLNRFTAEFLVSILCFLCGFGIYLGRYLRFNSWDVMSNPDELIGEIADRITDPYRHPQTIGVTLLYGAFLLAGYWVVHLLNWEKNEKVSDG